MGNKVQGLGTSREGALRTRRVWAEPSLTSLRPLRSVSHLLFALLALIALTAAVSAQPAACVVSDLASLRACIGGAAPGARISFARDVACRSAGECCPGGLALLRIMGVAGVSIDGNGHTLRREAAQKQCAALVVRNSPNLTMTNLTFDEDARAAPCELADKPCASTFDIGNTKGVLMDRVRVLFGKGYVIRLWTVEDFTFRRSEVADAGIIGFYAGHFKYGASHRVVLEDSRFLRARANGVALQGVDDAVVLRNRFAGNHWHGLWPVPNIPGGITPGGQLLLGQGTRMTVQDNSFAGNNCGNCNPSKLVTGLEVGEDAQSPGVKDLRITGNRICNTSPGMSIYHNPGANLEGAVVSGNRVSGFTGVDNLRGPVTRAGNVIAQGETCP